MKKLNFGCGSIQPEGWDNLDGDIESVFDVFHAPLRRVEYIDNPDEYDIIVAHAALQMNPIKDLPDILRNLCRVLKPGGVIRISLPDIDEGFKQYAAGNINWFPNSEEDIDLRFAGWLTWYGTSATLLTRGALRLLLEEAGFQHIRPVDFKKTSSAYPESVELDTREHEFYFMEGIK